MVLYSRMPQYFIFTAVIMSNVTQIKFKRVIHIFLIFQNMKKLKMKIKSKVICIFKHNIKKV